MKTPQGAAHKTVDKGTWLNVTVDVEVCKISFICIYGVQTRTTGRTDLYRETV